MTHWLRGAVGLLPLVISAQFTPVPGRVWAAEPLRIAVMDPLARPLSCACVRGYAQRDYGRLGKYLEGRLGRQVRVVYAEALKKAIGRVGGGVDLIVGKNSVVIADARGCGLKIRPLSRLTDKDGKTTLNGLFVVPAGDAARRLADLKGYRIIFGPADSEEKHAAARRALRAAAVRVSKKIETRPGCSDAAFEALESAAKPGTAAVISSYALALLEGCRTIEKGALRVVGKTEPVPFVTVFASESVDEKARGEILKALLDVRNRQDLLTALESKSGFVEVSVAASARASAGPA